MSLKLLSSNTSDQLLFKYLSSKRKFEDSGNAKKKMTKISDFFGICINDKGKKRDSEMIIVNVENQSLEVEKDILCRNSRFKAVIEDRLFDSVLTLHEDVKKDGFILLMKYYKGERIQIDKDNINSLFTICFRIFIE